MFSGNHLDPFAGAFLVEGFYEQRNVKLCISHVTNVSQVFLKGFFFNCLHWSNASEYVKQFYLNYPIPSLHNYFSLCSF